jgi:hypothetical protein
MANKVYPFASGSEYTASYAISSSVAVNVGVVEFVFTSSVAGNVINPISGSPADTDICILSWEEYQLLLSGSHYEVC